MSHSTTLRMWLLLNTSSDLLQIIHFLFNPTSSTKIINKKNPTGKHNPIFAGCNVLLQLQFQKIYSMAINHWCSNRKRRQSSHNTLHWTWVVVVENGVTKTQKRRHWSFLSKYKILYVNDHPRPCRRRSESKLNCSRRHWSCLLFFFYLSSRLLVWLVYFVSHPYKNIAIWSGVGTNTGSGWSVVDTFISW